MITAFETSVSVQTGGSAATIGLLRSVSELRMDSEMLDVTTLDAPGGWRRYARGARDGGEVTLEGFLDKEESGQETLRSLYLDSAPAAFTITFPDGESASFQALVRSVSWGAASVDEPVGFACVLRLCGPVAWNRGDG